jgi:hypothetical protein
LELFAQQLPDRPYCTDDFEHGVRIRPKAVAVLLRHVQPQPPWLRVWMVFDYDHDGSWYAADEAGLPAPTIIVVNPKNGHGHLLYGIDTPVRLEHWGGRRAPANYLAAVERAMTVRLGADPSYSGFMCKNPLHPHWPTLSNDHPYSLGELHGWLGDLNEYYLPERAIGIGRNVETFDATRKWAYRAVLPHKEAGGTLAAWEKACIGACGALHPGATPPASAPLRVRVDRAQREQVDVAALHGGGVLGASSEAWSSQRQGTTGGGCRAQPAHP